jgi:hypothetical protein
VNGKSSGGGLQVIGAGFGRSGTTSLRQALHELGYAPCYHMQTALMHCSHMKFWVRARAGEPVDFRQFFRATRATVDWPACEFYRELMALYPDARVLLNVRDPEAWYDSMIDTLWVIQRALPWWFPRVARQMHDDIIWNSRFKGRFTDRRQSIAVNRPTSRRSGARCPRSGSWCSTSRRAGSPCAGFSVSQCRRTFRFHA